MTLLETFDRKPSNAMQALIDGILRTQKRPDFVVSPDHYGMVGPDGRFHVCFATCALMEIIGRPLAKSEIESLHTGGICDPEPMQAEKVEIAGYEAYEVRRFLYAMDRARCGQLALLVNFCLEKPSQGLGVAINVGYQYQQHLVVCSKLVSRMPIWKDIVKKLKTAGC